jgi:chromosome segregation and condensation protein ScpB
MGVADTSVRDSNVCSGLQAQGMPEPMDLRDHLPNALSGAALEVLAIIAYEQPVTRADIRAIRGVWRRQRRRRRDAHGPQLIAEDPRFGGRGRPGFLITTAEFLRRFGLSSLAALPRRPHPATAAVDAMLSRALPAT